VRVVRALTHLSRYFFSIRSSDTPKESPKPEMSTFWKGDAAGIELDVAGKMP
jgi:hypothetical protein